MAKRQDGMEKIGRDIPVEKAHRGCLDKRRYDTKNRARDHARLIAKRYDAEPMRAYRCALCSGWHLTSAQPWGLSKRPKEAVSKRA